MKIPTIENMSEQTKIEAGIGFTWGIMLGAFSAMILILFFTPWEWYFKLFSFIGSAGILGSLYMSLSAQIVQRRNLISALAEMKKITDEEKNKIPVVEIPHEEKVVSEDVEVQIEPYKELEERVVLKKKRTPKVENVFTDKEVLD